MIAAATEVKEYPILFSAPMVRAILEGRKTQTRRIIKPRRKTEPAPLEMEIEPWVECEEIQLDSQGRPCFIGSHPDYKYKTKWFSCPYGQPGDRLWVKETWRQQDDEIIYRADVEAGLGKCPPEDAIAGWKSSLFMSKATSRIWLEIVDVRVERLQSISESNAQAEGCFMSNLVLGHAYDPVSMDKARQWFKGLWNSINGKTYPWDSNPWVWVVEFKRVES